MQSKDLSGSQNVGDLHLQKKTPYVEIIVITTDGVVNTLHGEFTELAQCLRNIASRAVDCPVDKLEPLMAIGQDIFRVSRDFLVSSIGTLYMLGGWSVISALSKNWPETAVYYVVVSY